MPSQPTTAVVVLTGGDLACLPEQVRQILTNQEQIMADFAALRSALETQKTELVAAVDRVAADVQALQDRIADLELDSADQAEVDRLAGQVMESVDTLRGIDPVAAVDDTEGTEPTPEPGTEPTP
jgi:phage I-like protein